MAFLGQIFVKELIKLAVEEVVEVAVVVGATAGADYVGIKAIVNAAGISFVSTNTGFYFGAKKTIYDWWGHSLSNGEYEKFRDWGYDVRSGCFSLEEVKTMLRLEVKAPGKPTKDDGFEPDKKWDGETLVRAPKSHHKKGYPDNEGRVWVPTGKGSDDGSKSPHGGSHWDRVYPDGTHGNVSPGGKVRPGTHWINEVSSYSSLFLIGHLAK